MVSEIKKAEKGKMIVVISTINATAALERTFREIPIVEQNEEGGSNEENLLSYNIGANVSY